MRSALWRVTRSVNLRISNSLRRGSGCSFGFEKVIVRKALVRRVIKGLRVDKYETVLHQIDKPF